MRAALSILGLVIVFAIVMWSARTQMQAVKPAVPAASGAASDAGLPAPRAVGRQVEDLLKQGEQRASEAMP